MMDGLVGWNISPRARAQAIIIESSSQFLVNIVSKVRAVFGATYGFRELVRAKRMKQAFSNSAVPAIAKARQRCSSCGDTF
jgi:hypothetical protein